MSSWSRHRKLSVAAIVLLLLIAAVAVPAFLLFYKAPSCFDGAENGSETGIDCGGRCERLCQDNFLPASVAWTRFEELAPGLLNVAAYIVNPNTEGEAKNVPYKLALYDGKGILIGEYNGTVNIPPHRNTLAFQTALQIGRSIPSKALFEFTAPPDWRKEADPLKSLSIGNKDYNEEGDASSLSVTLRNVSVSKSLGRMSVYTVLYDVGGNAIGFSKTIVDEIAPEESVIAPFTWPRSRQGRVVSIEVLPVAE